MAQEALGLLECKGLVALMEGSDAMLKAANVEMMGWDKAGSGMVTAFVRGDVAAVKAAVDAGDATNRAESGAGCVERREQVASHAELGHQRVVPVVRPGVEELRGAGVGDLARAAPAQGVVYQIRDHEQRRGGQVLLRLA